MGVPSATVSTGIPAAFARAAALERPASRPGSACRRRAARSPPEAGWPGGATTPSRASEPFASRDGGRRGPLRGRSRSRAQQAERLGDPRRGRPSAAPAPPATSLNWTSPTLNPAGQPLHEAAHRGRRRRRGASARRPGRSSSPTRRRPGRPSRCSRGVGSTARAAAPSRSPPSRARAGRARPAPNADAGGAERGRASRSRFVKATRVASRPAVGEEQDREHDRHDDERRESKGRPEAHHSSVRRRRRKRNATGGRRPVQPWGRSAA